MVIGCISGLVMEFSNKMSPVAPYSNDFFMSDTSVSDFERAGLIKTYKIVNFLDKVKNFANPICHISLLYANGANF